jgi:hypothetical protein
MSTAQEMFAADMPEFKKVEKQIDMILDSSVEECGFAGDPGDYNPTQNTPATEPEEELSRVHDAIAGYGDPEDIDQEYPPGQQDDEYGDEDVRDVGIGSQLESVLSINEKGEYHIFFKRMMDEEGISSIGQMDHDQKSSFFSKVSAAWKKEKGKSVSETFKHLI